MRIAAALLLVSLAACAPNRGPMSATSKDRSAIDLSEVVVSVKSDQGPRNLHVWFAILIIPTERFNEYELSDLSTVVRRTEGQIAAQATAELASRSSLPLASLGKLREELARNAQATLDAALGRRRWRDRFRVEAVITSLYFTDGSVGRARSAERWW
jgi:hypothetical protein